MDIQRYFSREKEKQPQEIGRPVDSEGAGVIEVSNGIAAIGLRIFLFSSNNKHLLAGLGTMHCLN